MEPLPIFFIHRGHSDYIRYTLDCARAHNPEAPIYLIGDQSTKYLEHLKISHIDFSELPNWDEFDQVFRRVATSDYKQDEDWIKFVFKRWHYLSFLTQSLNLKRFWTFDTDTLILCNLAQKAHKFLAFDFTTQAHGHQINGFISSQDGLTQYLQAILAMFKDNDFIAKTEAVMAGIQGASVSDMTAFDYAIERSFFKEFKHVRLGTIIDNEIFDDALCHDDIGFEKSEFDTKRLYLIRDTFYFRHLESDRMIAVNTLNMSWIQTFYIAQIFFYRLQLARAPVPEGQIIVCDVPKASN